MLWFINDPHHGKFMGREVELEKKTQQNIKLIRRNFFNDMKY